MGLDLVTLAEYKQYMGITNPTNDAVLAVLITKVSSLVKKICRRTFVDYVDDAKVDYCNSGLMPFSPSEYPIISVGSVEFSSDYGQTYTNLTAYTDYVLDSQAEEIKFLVSPYNTDISQPNSFRITFNAGYEELPEDLKLAVFDLITYYVRNDGAVHSNKNPGANTIQIDYVTNNKLPAHISRVLELYMANYA
jgi:hypothetical protein